MPTSGAIGVCWDKQNQKWRAEIIVEQRTIYLGLFKHYSAAVKARKKAEFKYDYHPNQGAKKK